jgi:peptide subunit release factor 1 (eRF1)
MKGERSMKIQDEKLKKIIDYVPDGSLVASVYLMVDGGRTTKKDYLTKINSMIIEAREILEKDEDIEKANKKKVYDNLENIKSYVNDKFKIDKTKTLLIYAASNGLWEIFKLPVVLKSRIIIDPKPHTQYLRQIVESYKNYGVLLIDREKAQIFKIYMGEISEYLAAFISEVPPKVNYRREAMLNEKKIVSRIEEKLHQFFKMINEKAFNLFNEGKFDYLIIAGRKDIVPDFNNYLHSYLQSRYIGTFEEDPAANQFVILEKAQKVIEVFEEKKKDEIISKIVDEYSNQGLAVLGIEKTIEALLLDQIKVLVYDEDFKAKGHLCPKCNYIEHEHIEECPYCEIKPMYFNDVIDEIVENALNQGSEVISVEKNEKLIKNGNIAAILRYKL